MSRFFIDSPFGRCVPLVGPHLEPSLPGYGHRTSRSRRREGVRPLCGPQCLAVRSARQFEHDGDLPMPAQLPTIRRRARQYGQDCHRPTRTSSRHHTASCTMRP